MKAYCYAQNGVYRIFYDFFYFATFSFTTPILMIIIELVTFRNIHHSRARINPNVIAVVNSTHLKNRDRHLITMLVIQLITIVMSTLPIAIQMLYTTFTAGVPKSAYRVAIELCVSFRRIPNKIYCIYFSLVNE